MSESSIFSNAHDFHIDTINHYGVTPGRPPLDRGSHYIAPMLLIFITARVGLLERVSHGAIHDSAERGRDAPKCHPETRVAVQQEIVSWVKHGDRDAHPARILWLSGPAGSGKTAIAGTVAEECHREGLLAASFFFSGFSQSLDRRLRGYFVATLAYQLLQHRSLPPIRDTVLSVIEGDPAILHKNLDEQIEQLILRPLRVAAGRGPKGRWPTVILVDGLDECDVHPDQRFETKQDRQSAKEDVHREILTALIRATSDPSFPFRIIIASRPEPAIHSVISSTQMVRNVFLDDKYTPEKDIETFVRAMLTKVGRDYGLRPNWFAQHIPRTLAQRSSGQFIYATTALRFIQDRTRPPHEQLKRVLGWTQFDASEGNPFAALDALYARILKTSPNPSLAAKWISATNGRSDATIVAIFPDQFKKALLESFPGETQYLLGSLTSLICTNPNEGQIFSLYHQTLVDFLGDRGRSGDLHVSKADVVKFNKDCCHSILKSKLFGGRRVSRVLTFTPHQTGALLKAQFHDPVTSPTSSTFSVRTWRFSSTPLGSYTTTPAMSTGGGPTYSLHTGRPVFWMSSSRSTVK